jgi:hypothetical protein
VSERRSLREAMVHHSRYWLSCLQAILSPQSKFRSKSLIDTVLHRGSDSGGIGARNDHGRLRSGMCLAGYRCSLAGGRFRRSGEQGITLRLIEKLPDDAAMPRASGTSSTAEGE